MKLNEVLIVRADSFKGKKDPTKTYYTMECILPTNVGYRAKQFFIDYKSYEAYQKPGIYEYEVNLMQEITSIKLVKEVTLP